MEYAEIGIIGGSGFYEMEGLEEVHSVKLATPFGASRSTPGAAPPATLALSDQAWSAAEDGDQAVDIQHIGEEPVVVEVDVAAARRRVGAAGAAAEDRQEVIDIARIGKQRVAVKVNGIAGGAAPA